MSKTNKAKPAMKLQPKLNEYFQVNARGLYDHWKLDSKKGFFRHTGELSYKEFKDYQEKNGPVLCKAA